MKRRSLEKEISEAQAKGVTHFSGPGGELIPMGSPGSGALILERSPCE
jgi:hypothetical protein